jgi:two-component system, cell cycle sensor histidine kinase and response regulator CckA
MSDASGDTDGDAVQSERDRVESALAQSEERFHSVVQGAPDGVAILRGATILYLNPRGARMLGLATPTAAIGRMITEFIHPDEAQSAAGRIRELLRTGQAPETPHEYRSRSLDGRDLTVEISSIRIDFDGGPAVLAFARDVTYRKALEGRVAQAERLSALGVLSAGVAHEINNPLAYVLLNLEFIEQTVESLPEGPVRETLLRRAQEAQHGAGRVASIVRDLRTFARDDASSRAPVSVEKTLEAAISMASAELEKRARLVRRFDEVATVLGNAARLEQVFVNLLTNAVHSLPDGGPEKNVITLTIFEDDRTVYVGVSDTGTGMSEDVRRQIFDPFFTTKPPGVGTGLGLPICQGILRAHGGAIDVASTPGQGSTFTVTLPRAEASATTAEERPPANRQPAQRGRVLIVDDDVNVGRTLSMALRELHDVTVVTSGQEALAELHAAHFAGGYEAILCDVLMPGMTGSELFDRVRGELPGLDTRFVFMSGGLFLDGAAELAKKSQNPVLEKPFDLDDVREALRGVVMRSRDVTAGS